MLVHLFHQVINDDQVQVEYVDNEDYQTKIHFFFILNIRFLPVKYLYSHYIDIWLENRADTFFSSSLLCIIP